MSWFAEAMSAAFVCLAVILIGRLFWTKFKIKHNIQAQSPLEEWRLTLGIEVKNTENKWLSVVGLKAR